MKIDSLKRDGPNPERCRKMPAKSPQWSCCFQSQPYLTGIDSELNGFYCKIKLCLYDNELSHLSGIPLS